jgi:mycofactocin precursor
MSERAGTADGTDSTEVSAGLASSAELATADLLVEEVSIDGMCGVY